MIKKLMCKIGLHKWSGWKISPYQALSAIEDNEYSYKSECERCSVIKYKTFDGLNEPK